MVDSGEVILGETGSSNHQNKNTPGCEKITTNFLAPSSYLVNHKILMLSFSKSIHRYP